ncbi:MAG TPA: ATP-binding cassette domain-containing protein, partial [Polyangia bacterium]|nr:ATP-binding cassette domain-containing protein [Polyangia bacterium]
ERLERPDDQWQHAGKIGLSFQTGGDLGGKEIIRAPDLTVGYPGAKILDGVTVNVYRGDKLGVVGPNGSGKSTLLRTLIGELAPLAGKVEFGSGVRIGYFDQKLGTLDEQLTLTEEIRSVRADLSPEAVRQYLAKFRFFGDDPFRLVRGLSGGERSRLAMAKIMLFPRNVLVLDEPTNHLDIPARETLEDALGAYEGTLITVSHDRYFLDRICTRLLVIEGTQVEAHVGNYSDWRGRVKESTPVEPAAPPPKPAPTATPKAISNPISASAVARDDDKRREREQRRLARRVETLEADVSKLEAELGAVRADLVGDHAGDWQKLHALAERERELDALLARRIAEWEAASAAALNPLPNSSD